ncbi:MAG TPA: type II toxin-antitoxin system Phd/YefM family antitoxin [Anaerolineales bacterium]|nr:type II toxin-antitoxin system Phd/YefM family antitoxin [Anaerolineales bacterium]
MDARVSSSEARQRFAELVGQAQYGGQVTVIERSGKPVVAMIPIDMYERLVAERESRFEILDQIRSKAPRRRPDQVDRDVAEALAAVRGRGAARRP